MGFFCKWDISSSNNKMKERNMCINVFVDYPETLEECSICTSRSLSLGACKFMHIFRELFYS